MDIGGLQKYTLIDYPEKIACVVFLTGCNFRCPFCYSAELVLPEKIKKQPKISKKFFFDFLKKSAGFLEAVVVCGGEPTIHRELPNFLAKIKKMGYAVKLDTNGSNPEMLEYLIKKNLVDYVAMDIKINLKSSAFAAGRRLRRDEQDSDLKNATGVKANPNDFKKTVELIKKSGIDYEFRTTMVPGLHDKNVILKIIRSISPAKKYFLQNFRPEKTLNPSFQKLKPYSERYLRKIQKTAAPFFEICRIR